MSLSIVVMMSPVYIPGVVVGRVKIFTLPTPVDMDGIVMLVFSSWMKSHIRPSISKFAVIVLYRLFKTSIE